MKNKGLKVSVLLLMVIVALAMVNSTVFAESPAQRDSNGMLVLMTDWGTEDFFVGAVKGVAYSLYPELNVVDLSHDIEEYNILAGANTLMLAAREFPTGTTFVGVVDPGVGTERRPIAMETECGRFFILPDNGLITLVEREFGTKAVYYIENEDYMRPGEISYTFHGRDIFVPTGAHIAAGRPIEEVGPEITDYETKDIESPVYEDGRIEAQVININVYGNMQTNFDREFFKQMDLERGDEVTIRIGDVEETAEFAYTYGDVPEGETLIYVSSTDFVSIAVNLRNAAERFGAETLSDIVIEKK